MISSATDSREFASPLELVRKTLFGLPQTLMNSDVPSDVHFSVATSPSLILQVKARDHSAWKRLAFLYGPMIYRWTRKAGLQASDSQDVVQNVFLCLVSDITQFRKNRPGDSFRGWLWTICRHKIIDHFREEHPQACGASDVAFLQHLGNSTLPELDDLEASDERRRLRHRAVALLRQDFDTQVWEAFYRTVVHGDRPPDVAADLGISVATVYRSKFRVLNRLRSELEDL